MSRGIGDEYHHQTKYRRDKLSGGFGPLRQPDPFKVCEKNLGTVELPEIKPPDDSSLWRALGKRRSHRSFVKNILPFSDLNKLIFAGQGVTKSTGGYLFRTAPSAGGLFPIETYIIVNRVEGLDSGLYHLNVLHQRLELLDKSSLELEITRAAMGQEMCATAAVDFIWTAIPDRSKGKYKDRAYRYIYMDAGHICQNLYLAAEEMNLGCCAIGAFFDDEINAILGVDGELETVVYMAAVGFVKG